MAKKKKRKRKKKKNILILELKRPKPAQYRQMPIVTGADVMRIVRREAKRTKKHFETDGWDLDYYGCLDWILYDLFGTHVSDMFLAEVLHACKGKVIWDGKVFTKVKK